MRCLAPGLLVAAFAMHAMPAGASVFCPVLKTRDRFVALRAAPRADAPLLQRVPFGQDVQIDDTRETSGPWLPVIYWGPRRDLNLAGWIHGRYVSQECG